MNNDYFIPMPVFHFFNDTISQLDILTHIHIALKFADVNEGVVYPVSKYGLSQYRNDYLRLKGTERFKTYTYIKDELVNEYYNWL